MLNKCIDSYKCFWLSQKTFIKFHFCKAKMELDIHKCVYRNNKHGLLFR